MKKAFRLLQLYVAPRACLEAIVEECLSEEGAEREDHVRSREWGRIARIRKASVRSLVFVAAIGIAGYLGSVVLDWFLVIDIELLRSLRVAASLVIAWAVLSRLSKEIESYKGRSLPEQLNTLAFRSAYFVGVGLVICTLFLEVEQG